eukprot:9771451-Alexandrium_andersonii.AAC.1
MEPRGPRNDLGASLRNSRGMRAAQFFASIPNLTTNGPVLGFSRGVRGASEGGFRMGFRWVP